MQPAKSSTLIAALTLLTLLAACAAPEQKNDAPPRLSALPAVVAHADNPMTPEKIALGKQLFFDAHMSGSGKMACENCHYHQMGWAVPEFLSTRDDGKLNTRHTPTLYNVACLTAFSQIVEFLKTRTSDEPLVRPVLP